MELRAYYQKIREKAASITDPFVVVVSHETADGGKAGVETEVPKYVAAKMIVEGKVRLASDEETRDHQQRKSEEKRLRDQLDAAGRMQVTVVSESDLRNLKNAIRSSK